LKITYISTNILKRVGEEEEGEEEGEEERDLQFLDQVHTLVAPGKNSRNCKKKYLFPKFESSIEIILKTAKKYKGI
jgi:hypothetical protein